MCYINRYPLFYQRGPTNTNIDLEVQYAIKELNNSL